MEVEDMLYDESEEIDNMKKARKEMNTKDFAKLINKRDLSEFEMDELFL
ncbi:hypothetical protein HYU10_02380 [Candidatus Woesearchaeota archaeon]|nr:hypothetical protein [Candidatus Woesearchaeota archaeon]MBI2130594.1 hypothetical protein [Candidatus Woesearchaeota archaeon]MBI2660691.1 hypothetical protein [Candidatus Woesearchaeota archaeon]